MRLTDYAKFADLIRNIYQIDKNIEIEIEYCFDNQNKMKMDPKSNFNELKLSSESLMRIFVKEKESNRHDDIFKIEKCFENDRIKKIQFDRSNSKIPLGFHIRQAVLYKSSKNFGIMRKKAFLISRIIPNCLLTSNSTNGDGVLINVNDEIFKVNGVKCSNLSLDEVAKMISQLIGQSEICIIPSEFTDKSLSDVECEEDTSNSDFCYLGMPSDNI